MDELLGAFVADCRERLAALENELCRLVLRRGDTELLASVFRGVHTIKGTCGFLGLGRLHDIAHAIEDVLDGLRRGELVASEPVISLLLEALDRITLILDQLDSTGLEPTGDDARLIAALEALATGGVGALGSALATAPKVWRHAEALRPASFLSRRDEITSAPQADASEISVAQIGAAWRHLPRLVQHLAIQLDKPMELEMHGAEIEIDRCLVEPIKASLVHLVRNAADHGLEDCAERRRRGKRQKGRIVVTACREADQVVIEVRDDGRGLDTEQITKTAVTSRLVDPADAAAMTTADCQRLLFLPGFTTAGAVTAVSGRGVGMDAVRDGIERLDGTIKVRSAPGRGCVFSMKVPRSAGKATAETVGIVEKRRASPKVQRHQSRPKMPAYQVMDHEAH